MNKIFHLTDQGHLEYYLGVEVAQLLVDDNTLMLHQEGHIKNILE